MTLLKEKCEPCHKDGVPLSVDDALALSLDIPDWELLESSIQRTFALDSFKEAIGFVNQVAEVAEEQEHHPDIFVDYRNVTLTLWTKKIGGLSRNDFILAAKIDELAD